MMQSIKFPIFISTVDVCLRFECQFSCWKSLPVDKEVSVWAFPRKWKSELLTIKFEVFSMMEFPRANVVVERITKTKNQKRVYLHGSPY